MNIFYRFIVMNIIVVIGISCNSNKENEEIEKLINDKLTDDICEICTNDDETINSTVSPPNTIDPLVNQEIENTQNPNNSAIQDDATNPDLPDREEIGNNDSPDSISTNPAVESNILDQIVLSSESSELTLSAGNPESFAVGIQNTGETELEEILIRIKSDPHLSLQTQSTDKWIKTQDIIQLIKLDELQSASLDLRVSTNISGSYSLKIEVYNPDSGNQDNPNGLEIPITATINNDINVMWNKQHAVIRKGLPLLKTILLENRGLSAAEHVEVTLNYPDHITLEPINTANVCDLSNLKRCIIDRLDANDTIQLDFHLYGSEFGIHQVNASTSSNNDANTENNNANSAVLVSGSGIIDFDTVDNDSILLRSALTSKQSVLDVGGSEEPDSANFYDTELGMIPYARSRGIPGVKFSAEQIPALSEIPEGQMSIEVEREWLAINMYLLYDPVSIGYRPEEYTPDYLLSFGDDPETAGKIYKQYEPDIKVKPKKDFLHWSYSTDYRWNGVQLMNAPIQSRFAKLTLSWTHDEIQLYVDGLLVESRERDEFNAAQLSNIHIGNFLGTRDNSFTNFAGRYFIRNLIIVSEPVQLFQPEEFQFVLQFGDSFAAHHPYSTDSNSYDKAMANNAIARLANLGLTFGKYTTSSYGGHQIQDNGSLPLEPYREADILKNPSIVLFITGGNDVGIYDEANFRNDLMDHIEAFMGENGYSSTSVEYFALSTTTYGSNPKDTRASKMAEIMLEMPELWNQKYPNKSGKVRVIDMTEISMAKDAKTYFGVLDKAHPSIKGWDFYGEKIAEQLLEILFDNANSKL